MACKKKNQPRQESKPSNSGCKADADNGSRPAVNYFGRHLAGWHLIKEIAVGRFHQHLSYHRIKALRHYLRAVLGQQKALYTINTDLDLARRFASNTALLFDGCAPRIVKQLIDLASALAGAFLQ